MQSCINRMAFPPIRNFRFQTQEDQDHSFPSTQNLPGFLMMKRSMSFSGTENINNNNNTNYLCEDGTENNLGHGDDDSSDDGNQFGVGEKKKRLNMEQVKALEKSFDKGNKLEPERKMQLARALGLQPKQIAIWFQNRRARCKTKQLERDYEVLRKQFEALKADNDALQLHNKKLRAELVALRSYRDTTEAGAINLTRETERTLSNGSDNSSVINLDLSRPTSVMNSPVSSQLNSKQNMMFSTNMTTQQVIHHHGTSRPDIQCFKIDQMVQDESFCSMFNGTDDHQGFWTWTDQNQFH